MGRTYHHEVDESEGHVLCGKEHHGMVREEDFGIAGSEVYEVRMVGGGNIQ